MTNGEKFKEVFGVSQVDEGELYAFAWLPNHDASEFSIDWWNAEYKEPTTKNYLGVDCISRADVLKLMQDNWHTHNGDWAMQESMDDIRALPSVTSQPRKGHWIPTYGNVECSVCGSVKDSRDVGKATHYCEFCGAMMVEPQESEDKE